MVWSNCRGAVVVVLAWVGLAWSQAPMPTSSTGAQRVLTVHENGKSLRCRVIVAWTMQDGAKAYQVQTLDTREMITIVQDGQSSTVREPNSAKVKALPMRIFHWGTSQVPPPGVPRAPAIVHYSSMKPPAEPIFRTAAQVPAPVITTVPMPETKTIVTGPGSSSCPTCGPMAAPGVTGSGAYPSGRDEIIWWEEKNGQRVSPKMVSGNNPFENETVVVNTPHATCTSPACASSPIITMPGMESVRMGTSQPMIRSVVQSGPIVVDNGVPVEGDTREIEVPEKKAPFWRNLFSRNQHNAEVSPQAISVIPEPPPQPPPPVVKPAPRPAGAYVQTGPTMLPNKAVPRPITCVPQQTSPKTLVSLWQTTNPPAKVVAGVAKPGPVAATLPEPISSLKIEAVPTTTVASVTAPAPAAPTTPAPTPAAAASNTRPVPAVAQAPRVTLMDRMHNWLHPKQDAKPADTKQIAQAPLPRQALGTLLHGRRWQCPGQNPATGTSCAASGADGAAGISAARSGEER